MFDVELFARMFELVNRQLKLIHKRIHLSSVLIIDVCNIDPTLLQQGPFITLSHGVALAVALLHLSTALFAAVFHLVSHFLV